MPKKEQDILDQAAPAKETAEAKPKKTRRYSWAELLARVFSVDMKNCPLCGGDFKVISVIMEASVVKKILTHLDLPFRPPDIAPARSYPQMSFR